MSRQRAPSPTEVQKFPPLEEVREKLVVSWYRCKVPDGRLSSYFMKRSDEEGAFQTLGHLCLWLCSASVVYHCWLNSSYGAMILAMFVHGTIGSTMLYGCHELGHGTVFQTKWLNRLFLHIYSLLAWWDPYDYASSHTYHHRYSQYPEGDRENLFPLVPSLDLGLMLELFTVNLTSGPGRVFGTGGLISTIKLRVKAAMGGIASEPQAESHEWLERLHEDQPEEAVKSMQWNRCIVAFHASVLLLSLLSGQWVFVLIINLHVFVANWYSYFVGETQHCGLRGSVADFRKNTRSIALDPFSEFLFWRMNWHIEHHMFAAVPCYKLGELHRCLAHDMPAPRSLLGAWREMRETWLKQQSDPGYEFDTPLPPTASAETGAARTKDGFSGSTKAESESMDAGAAHSIGDLAPGKLSSADMNTKKEK